MPYATTHILIAIILIELFREYVIKNNYKFPRYYILIAAIGGILPDLDVGAYYLLYFFGFSFEQVHRTFLHSLFFPLILFLIGIFIYYTGIKNSEIRKRHLKLSTIFFILSAGSLLHLILDAVFWGQIVPFYPLMNYSIGFNLVEFFPEGFRSTIAPVIDAILMMFWLFWMEFKLKISNYF